MAGEDIEAGEDYTVRDMMDAAKALLDRGYGRAPVSVDLTSQGRTVSTVGVMVDPQGKQID